MTADEVRRVLFSRGKQQLSVLSIDAHRVPSHLNLHVMLLLFFRENVMLLLFPHFLKFWGLHSSLIALQCNRAQTVYNTNWAFSQILQLGIRAHEQSYYSSRLPAAPQH